SMEASPSMEASASPEASASAEASASPEASASAAASETSTAGGAMVELPEVDPAAVSGDVVTSGSSTVFPLSQRLAERFKEEGYAGTVSVDEVGTGAGFQRFCEAGETDIANASRPIKDEEKANCEAINRNPIEFRVGTDALAIVVSSENDFLTNLTLEQLGKIYTGEFKQWSDVDASYPAEAIQLYSPGTDSGTYDYFAEVVLEDDEAKITAFQGQNPTQSENDNVLVQGVESSPNAIGYFGYAYYLENKDRLKILSIDGVEPTEETAENGEYALSRPLFIYSTAEIIKEKPQVGAFINFYLTTVNDEIIDVGYFPASEEAINGAKQAFLDATK
ncbi:MAG TPA: PstS family phosphate ABC transporter substrate-binding protein, partial [Herpetosiphonaceae bacterium]